MTRFDTNQHQVLHTARLLDQARISANAVEGTAGGDYRAISDALKRVIRNLFVGLHGTEDPEGVEAIYQGLLDGGELTEEVFLAEVELAAQRVAPKGTTSVEYRGGGQWSVTRDGVRLGTLRQGYFETWFAKNAEGEKLQINGHDEYGGHERPIVIATTMVEWAA
jgi:hypothetical protein